MEKKEGKIKMAHKNNINYTKEIFLLSKTKHNKIKHSKETNKIYLENIASKTVAEGKMLFQIRRRCPQKRDKGSEGCLHQPFLLIV